MVKPGPIAKKRYKRYLKGGGVNLLGAKEMNELFGLKALLKGEKMGLSRRSRGAKKYKGKGAWRDLFSWKY